MLLGMARGKVGSLVFYRKNGKQITRAKAETVNNPKTNAQLVQRAIAASIAQAYSAGKAIFDHSFQGKSVPAGSMNRFRKVNMDKLRAAVVADLNGAINIQACEGRVVAPGAVVPAPWTFRVSEGELVQNLYTVAASSGDANQLEATLPAAASDSETVAQYASRLNLVAGDIYTLVAFGSFAADPTDSENYYSQQNAAFGFIRLIVKSGLSEVSTLVSAATLTDVFTIDTAGTPIPGSTLLTSPINIDQVVSSCTTGCLGVIKSREDSGKRSTTDLQAPAVMGWGISSAALLDVWSAESSLESQSKLILEGGNF